MTQAVFWKVIKQGSRQTQCLLPCTYSSVEGDIINVERKKARGRKVGGREVKEGWGVL